MPVDSIECQIAKGQIGRYLAGESFSPTGLQQLEEHVANCTSCKTLLAERRQALLKMLGQEEAATPMIPNTIAISPEAYERRMAAQATAPEADTLTAKAINDSLRDRMIDQMRLAQAALTPPTTPVAKPEIKSTSVSEKIAALFVVKPQTDTAKTSLPTQSSFARPIMYTVALAGVLVAMALITKNGGFMGTRGGSALAKAPTTIPGSIAASTISTSLPLIRSATKSVAGVAFTAAASLTETSPVGAAANSVTNAAISSEANIDEPAPKPAPIRAARPVVRTVRPVRQTTPPPARKTPPSGTIKVYDADGNAINAN